jgi:hypothetical protein
LLQAVISNAVNARAIGRASIAVLRNDGAGIIADISGPGRIRPACEP